MGRVCPDSVRNPLTDTPQGFVHSLTTVKVWTTLCRIDGHVSVYSPLSLICCCCFFSKYLDQLKLTFAHP